MRHDNAPRLRWEIRTKWEGGKALLITRRLSNLDPALFFVRRGRSEI